MLVTIWVLLLFISDPFMKEAEWTERLHLQAGKLSSASEVQQGGDPFTTIIFIHADVVIMGLTPEVRLLFITLSLISKIWDP